MDNLLDYSAIIWALSIQQNKRLVYCMSWEKNFYQTQPFSANWAKGWLRRDLSVF